ncbi:hypothetical protein S7711_09143 [Stachybotrys chartarum IBT 7711]|uniref:Oxidoreductase NAD-binding domain-containing protein 1 n=1 Tax=Stachybotrys chartarum (strain CBS 109288 / IBT 7711) TaxID=1280523 RepID=A0A084AHN2_STACB|nr:hypothetical protein S7711_09143 [Stachybotrys chartarum IBT 7711]KFA46709.1 hypothetical protein S40293_07794 [Stachybotrys chartarum IBT 40293]
MALENKDGHLERTAAEPRDKDLHTVTISRIDYINENIRLFHLPLLSGPIKFLPGQWLDTFVPGLPKPGGFTLTCAPSAAARPHSPYLELAVQRAPDGPAGWLWRPVCDVEGQRLRVRVGGSFVFPPPAVTGGGEMRRVVFVAGGVGVNPLASMLSALADAEDGRRVAAEVLYATKLPREGLRHILFLERIAALFGTRRLRGRIALHLTGGGEAPRGPSEVCGARVDVRAGRLSAAELRAAVAREDAAGTFVYVCGPPGMTDEFVEALAGGEEPVVERRRVLTEKWW